MPRLSDTMTDGVVVKWHKKIGDVIKEGDLLADIETDKATMEFEAFQEGVLLYIGVKENATAEVDHILAILGEKDEDITTLLDSVSNEIIMYYDFVFYMPKSFTPNNDNKNETFGPKGLRMEYYESYNFIIYNKWGGEVFNTDKVPEYNLKGDNFFTFGYRLQFHKYAFGLSFEQSGVIKNNLNNFAYEYLESIEIFENSEGVLDTAYNTCLLYTSPSPRDS